MSDLDHQFVFTDNTLDLYKTLGVNTDASVETIRDKYRELARIYHPDKAKNQDRATNTKLYEKIKQAYEILSSSNLREQYDRILQSSFADLKREYKDGPAVVVPVKNIDAGGVDQFNHDFIRDAGITRKINDYESKSRATDFESYKAQRNNINIENKFGQSIPTLRIKGEATSIYEQLQVIEKKLGQAIYNTNESDFKILCYLLSQFKNVRDNIENNILIIVDFLLACKTLDKADGLKVEYDHKFVNQLNGTINNVEGVNVDQLKKYGTLTSYEETDSLADMNFKNTLLDDDETGV